MVQAAIGEVFSRILESRGYNDQVSIINTKFDVHNMYGGT